MFFQFVFNNRQIFVLGVFRMPCQLCINSNTFGDWFWSSCYSRISRTNQIVVFWGRDLGFIKCEPPIIHCDVREREREREMFYITTHSTHFIYGFMASDIWLRTILIVRKETRCRHIGYSYRLTARVLLYAPSHKQDNTYHGLCYTSSGALAGTRM